MKKMIKKPIAKSTKQTTEKKRLLAEIDNLRKNYAERQREIVLYGQQKIMEEMIGVLNSFELSLQFTPQQKETKQFLTGMKMGVESLFAVLQQHGLRKITTKVGDEYDSEFHEIIEKTNDPREKDGRITAVNQTGYMLYERVLQPTKIVVNSHAQNKELMKKQPKK